MARKGKVRMSRDEDRSDLEAVTFVALLPNCCMADKDAVTDGAVEIAAVSGISAIMDW